jgi:hypothetical protein
MNLVKSLKKMCLPSILYLVFSLLVLVILGYQNMNNSHTLCVGDYSCAMPSVVMFFVFNILYVLFWVWILNLICKAGWKWVSWILVLFPFVLAFLLVILGMTKD